MNMLVTNDSVVGPMTKLPTGLASTLTPQRFRCWFGERGVRRGWLGGVGRVHPQPALQFGVLGFQRGDRLSKLRDHLRLPHDQGGKLVIRHPSPVRTR